jgi:hypothetical protein
MTEAEWLKGTAPEPMLEFLKGRASERKLRLVACACCRRIWHLLDSWSQNVVAVAEQQVDGSVPQVAMTFAAELHRDVILEAKPYTARHIAAGIANAILSGAAWALAWNTVSEVRRALLANRPQADTYSEAAWQAAIVRDLFGNPFRPTAFSDTWLTPNVVKVSQAIYKEQSVEGMPVLADALEEGGCARADILAHCRGSGPHARGCWVVDLLLGMV